MGKGGNKGKAKGESDLQAVATAAAVAAVDAAWWWHEETWQEDLASGAGAAPGSNAWAGSSTSVPAEPWNQAVPAETWHQADNFIYFPYDLVDLFQCLITHIN